MKLIIRDILLVLFLIAATWAMLDGFLKMFRIFP